MTELDVAFAGIVVAGIGAVAAPLTTWLTMKARHRHERATRLYNDKKLAYIRLLADTRRKRFVLDERLRILEEGRNLGDAGEDFPPFDYDSFLETVGLANAFASAAVDEAIDAYEEPLMALFDEIDAIDQYNPAQRAAAIRAIREGRPLLIEKYRELRVVVSDELGAR